MPTTVSIAEARRRYEEAGLGHLNDVADRNEARYQRKKYMREVAKRSKENDRARLDAIRDASVASFGYSAFPKIDLDPVIRAADVLVTTFDAAKAAAAYVAQVNSYKAIDLDIDRLESQLYGGTQAAKDQLKWISGPSGLPKALELATAATQELTKEMRNLQDEDPVKPPDADIVKIFGHTFSYGQMTRDLQYLSDAINLIEPSTAKATQGILLFITHLRTFHAATTLLGTVGGAVSIFAGAFSLVTSLFGSGKSAAEKYAEEQRRAEEATRKHAEALRAYERDIQNYTRHALQREVDLIRSQLGQYGPNASMVITESGVIHTIVSGAMSRSTRVFHPQRDG